MKQTIHGRHSVALPVPAAQAWQILRNFGDLSWVDGIAEIELEGNGIGMLRKVRLEGSDDWIPERLVSMDDAAMHYRYILEGDGYGGLTDYCAEARLERTDDGCALSWHSSATIEASEVNGLQQVIDGVAAGIVTCFAAQFTGQDVSTP